MSRWLLCTRDMSNVVKVICLDGYSCKMYISPSELMSTVTSLQNLPLELIHVLVVESLDLMEHRKPQLQKYNRLMHFNILVE